MIAVWIVLAAMLPSKRSNSMTDEPGGVPVEVAQDGVGL
jgi:hypothetical protein